MFAKDYRNLAWTKLSGKWGIMALCTLIYSLILGACSSFANMNNFDGAPPSVKMLFTSIGTVASLLLSGPFIIGMSTLALNVSRGKEVKVEQLFSGFKNYASALALYLINSIFIALWSLLLIVPGIIKAISYSMSYYILIDNPNMGANEARKQSMAMMEGHKWRYFCLMFSFIGWIILCVLTLGILTFWVTPYIQTAQSEFYHSLLAERGYATHQPEPDGSANDTATAQTQPPAEPFEEYDATKELPETGSPEQTPDENEGNQTE